MHGLRGDHPCSSQFEGFAAGKFPAGRPGFRKLVEEADIKEVGRKLAETKGVPTEEVLQKLAWVPATKPSLEGEEVLQMLCPIFLCGEARLCFV